MNFALQFALISVHKNVVLAQPVAITSGDRDGITLFVYTGIVHSCGNGAWGGNETLYLLRAPTSLAEPLGEFTHVVIGAAGEGADKIGNDILFFPGVP